jgi:hypothetical protein
LKHNTSCAHCNTTIADIDTEITNYHAHSAVIIAQHVSDKFGYEFYQHASDQKVHGHNWNHWHCSQEHMMAALPDHISRMNGTFESPQPGNVVNMGWVLEEGYLCAQCSKSLKHDAYRITITYATPISVMIHNQGGEDGWCCSMDHAKAHAGSTMIQYAKSINK